MTYAELIRVLWERSGLDIAAYARAIGTSRTHISNIVNDEQPGSIKILEDCLIFADKKDALRLDDDKPVHKKEAELLHMFRLLDDDRRELVLKTVRNFLSAVRATRSNHK